MIDSKTLHHVSSVLTALFEGHTVELSDRVVRFFQADEHFIEGDEEFKALNTGLYFRYEWTNGAESGYKWIFGTDSFSGLIQLVKNSTPDQLTLIFANSALNKFKS